jgi:ketosteroid isomerase-like protein
MTALGSGGNMKRIVIGCLVIGAVVIGLGCAADSENDREAIRQADIAFNRAVAEKDIEAFSELVAQEAVFYGTGLAEGREAVVRSWKPYFEPEASVTLSWSPGSAEVSASGDLGYTRGSYEMSVQDDNGARQRFAGSYVTIWEKGGDGRWRAAVDIGTPPQPVAEPASPDSGEVD